MNLKKLLFIPVLLGSYYFFQTLCTTRTISKVATLEASEAIQPDLVSKFNLDSLQEKISQETYIALLAKEEEKIWEKLKKTINLSAQDCKELKNKWHSYYEADARELQEKSKNFPALSAKTIEIVHSVMQNFDINQKSIVILPFQDYCPAAADDYSIFINESLFNLLSPYAQKFCIAHELQHFLHKDDSTNYVLLQHYTQEKSELSLHDPLNELSRIQELRADLGAAAKNKEYAQGYKEFSQTALAIIGDGEGITHPKNTLRISYADLFLANLNT